MIGLGINLFGGGKTLTQQAIDILRRFGTDAHVYLPGIGTISGLAAGNYTLSDGSTGVAAVDGPDGLVLDAAGTVGAEQFTTGFTGGTANTGATIDGSGAVVMTSVASGYAAFKDGTALAAGNTYQFTITYTGVTQNCGVLFQGGVVNSSAFIGTGTMTAFFVAPAITNSRIQVNNNSGSAASGTVSISVKQVTGIHASQPTAGFRPRLERGARNLLTYSQDFTNGAWAKGNGATFSGSVLTLPSTAYMLQAKGSLTPSAPYTMAFLLSGAGTVNIYANVGTSVPTDITLTSTPTIYVLAATSSAGGNVDPTIIRNGGNTATSVTVGAIGLFTGTLTAQQILDNGGIPLTTTSAASNPNAGRYSWAFDGVDDRLNLASVPFQRADDFCVTFAARQNVTGLGTMQIFSMRNSAATNSLIHIGVNNGGNVFGQLRDDASVNASIVDGVNRVGQVFVATLWQVSGTRYLRINGAQVGSDATVLGTTTLNTATIGATSTTTVNEFMNGMIGEGVVVKGTSTAADVLTLERFVSALTPNGPVF